MTTTPLLKLPQIAENQGSKHVTHNEALRQIEAVLVRVLSRSVSDETGLTPSDGDAYIVARASFAVVAVNTTSEIVTISGDETARFAAGDTLEISGSTGNDGTYTVASTAYDSGNDQTDITVNENLADATADGDVLHAAGAFNGNNDAVAYYYGGTWSFLAAFEGLGPLWVNDEDTEVRFNGSVWFATDSDVDISDDGTLVQAGTSGLDFGSNLSVVDNGDGTVTISGAASLPTDYITGLKLQWDSGTSLTIETGAAVIESTGSLLTASSPITKSALSLSASTWYHLYFYDNGGTPDIEVSTTDPAAPYQGTARSKSADTSRRYVGSVKTDSNGAVWNFLHVDALIAYRNKQDDSPFRILNGTATTETAVDSGPIVPVTARSAFCRIINTSDVTMRTGTSGDSTDMSSSGGIVALNANVQAFVFHPLNSVQELTYRLASTPSSGAGVIDVYGFLLER